MTISTALTAALAIRHPVLLAPMGDSAGGRLAAAVSAAGGLGMIGGGYADPDWLHRELALAGDERVGIGFITFALDRRPETLDVALEARPAAVQLSFGDPRPHVDAIRGAGAQLICQVQSEEEIRLAQEAGADVIIAQGGDAGGHGRPDRGTFGLIPSVVDQVAPVPVVAAGGIADGRGLAAALMLGAAGIVMGTRFLASHEAITTPAELAGLVAARSHETVRSEVFDVVRGPAWPSGYDGRAVRNSMTERWLDHPDADALRDEFRTAADDDYSIRPLWAGEGLDLIDRIESAGAILERVIEEATARLDSVRPEPTGAPPGV